MPNDNTLFKERATGEKKKKAQASEKDFVLTSTKKRGKKSLFSNIHKNE